MTKTNAFESAMAFDGLRIIGDEDCADAECHRARYRWVASMLEPGSYVLDYGCGTGYGSRILMDAGMKVYAYDPDVEACKIAQRRWGVNAAPSFDSGVFKDAVVCFEVLEHLKDPPLGTFMGLEKLAPIVIASVPYLEKPGNNQHHLWFRLQESTFPGRRIAYQYADGTISPMAGNAQNLIVYTLP